MRFIPVLLLLISCLDASAYERSRVVRAEFMREHPCPETGARRGACPGFEVDHVVPLCAGGPDAAENLQWLSHHAHALKTKRDVARCRVLRYFKR